MKKNEDVQLLKNVSSLSSNYELKCYAQKLGLDILKVTWEDTARFKDSCWGPNISDLTLQLANSNTLLPIIRKNNFTDVTADLPIKLFEIPIGNQDSKFSQITKIGLKDYLEYPMEYIDTKEEIKSLYDKERDKFILTSAQFCILPLSTGTCEFNVHILNHQSGRDPSVLILLVSQQGSSAQILDGKSPLYFNEKGMACNFVAERMMEVREREGESQAKAMTKDEIEKNCLYIFQIPIKKYSIPSNISTIKSGKHGHAKTFGTDEGILKHSEPHSPFLGVQNRKIERDFSYPIRCTLQFYKVTDVDITETLIESMGKRIDEVFSWGVEEGSLVEDDSNRKTEWIKEKDGDDIENEVNKKEKDELENTTPTEK